MGRRLGVGAALVALVGVAAPARAISFINSPSPYCRKVTKGQCRISFARVTVDGAPNQMRDLWILVDGKLVFHASGFFQSTMDLEPAALGEGALVKCGKRGATPPPDPTPTPDLVYGNAYGFEIYARDTAGLTSSNRGTVVCPAK